jgi:two-component system OmpR family sensor kinase
MMTWLNRLPIRARITVAFAAVMALLLLAISVSVYWSMSAALLDELDSGLRFRAAATASQTPYATIEPPNSNLEERGEAFDQLLTANGRVLRTSGGIGPAPLLDRPTLGGLRRPTFFERRLAGVQDTARLLALPVGGASTHQVLIVGTTMADRTDALAHLVMVYAIAGPIAIVVASLAGWFVAGLGLRPVERMRHQASAITASGLDHRLELPEARDELHRLGVTLNGMLDRLETAAHHDRRFLENASHELRTPLTALKAELDIATSGPRDAALLSAAIASAIEEVDRLIRLANDLLALARIKDGRMPIARETCGLRVLLDRAASASRGRARHHHITITVQAPAISVRVDTMRVRQALDNLIDNALRITPDGGTITVTAHAIADSIKIAVRDSGPGFSSLPKTRDLLAADNTTLHHGGLGLRIARTVAVSHGGELEIDNHHTEGAIVTLILADAGVAERNGVA